MISINDYIIGERLNQVLAILNTEANEVRKNCYYTDSYISIKATRSRLLSILKHCKDDYELLETIILENINSFQNKMVFLDYCIAAKELGEEKLFDLFFENFRGLHKIEDKTGEIRDYELFKLLGD